MTIDHIILRPKGGKTDWEKCVACCKGCNNDNGAKTPREARMHLIKRPFQPAIAEFIRMRLKQSAVYASWSSWGFIDNRKGVNIGLPAGFRRPTGDNCAIMRKIKNKYIAHYCALLYDPLILIERDKHVVVSAKPKIRK